MDLDSIKKVNLDPSDVIVLTFPNELTEAMKERYYRILNERFPSNHCIVLYGGANMTIIKTDP